MKREETYLETGKALANLSLLYPPGAAPDTLSFLEISPATAHDLGLDEIIAAFVPDRGHQHEIRAIFSRLPRDSEVITYRQAVLQDLLSIPALAERFASLLPLMDSLFESSHRLEREMPWLHEVVWRAGELQTIIECFEGMGDALISVEDRIQSEALRLLHAEIRTARNDPTYQRLVEELPGLVARLRGGASITIGVNLDPSLRPVQATLLTVNEKPFTDQSLLNRLFGVRGEQEGIAPLHSVPKGRAEGHLRDPIDPLMVPLFADLAKVLEQTALPIADQLRQYAGMHGQLFTNLRQGLIFYLGAVRLIRRLQKLGLSMCRPQIASAEERWCEVQDSYNLHLPLRESGSEKETGSAIVQNDIRMGTEGRILLLTGPNSGGKTTYMQGVGVVQILTQLGCYVPGVQAVVSPVDHLFTHFPLEEKLQTDTGRFGEEARRLGKIFEQVTRNSLVLLNETFSSTSFSESLYLAEDIVRILRRVGARAIYATHLHELAGRADALNHSVPGESKIISVVSSPIEASGAEMGSTYKLEIRPPLGQSYAREIATRYGISYEQLENVLSERGVLKS
ncbi:MAG TPA: hypothetical protein VFG81_19215 [Anaerolineales bacterium]|nr:hypothetical protein [Anaerolineales bacterium]